MTTEVNAVVPAPEGPLGQERSVDYFTPLRRYITAWERLATDYADRRPTVPELEQYADAAVRAADTRNTLRYLGYADEDMLPQLQGEGPPLDIRLSLQFLTAACARRLKDYLEMHAEVRGQQLATSPLGAEVTAPFVLARDHTMDALAPFAQFLKPPADGDRQVDDDGRTVAEALLNRRRSFENVIEALHQLPRQTVGGDATPSQG